jgi:hypothetical protein
VLRANENGFDAVLQFTDRAATLAANGHPVDKVRDGDAAEQSRR